MRDGLTVIAGVDPGVSGGIAFIDATTATAWKMPETRGDLVELVKRYAGGLGIVYVERVRSSPQMGVTSAFTFGCNYERVVMAFVCAGVPVEEVTPQKWQKALGCMTGGDKNISKARAQQLFPHLKVTHYIADALLIARYGQLQERTATL